MNSKKQADTENDNEILARIDCLNRNLGNLRSDISKIVREGVRDEIRYALSKFLKDHNKPKWYGSRL